MPPKKKATPAPTPAARTTRSTRSSASNTQQMQSQQKKAQPKETKSKKLPKSKQTAEEISSTSTSENAVQKEAKFLEAVAKERFTRSRETKTESAILIKEVTTPVIDEPGSESKQSPQDESSDSKINYHKKFGKFQCVVENAKQDDSNSKSESDENSISDTSLNVEHIENVIGVPLKSIEIGRSLSFEESFKPKTSEETTENIEETHDEKDEPATIVNTLETTELNLSKEELCEDVNTKEAQEVILEQDVVIAEKDSEEKEEIFEGHAVVELEIHIDQEEQEEADCQTEAVSAEDIILSEQLSSLDVNKDNYQEESNTVVMEVDEEVHYEQVNEVVLESQENQQSDDNEVFEIHNLGAEVSLDCISEEIIYEEQDEMEQDGFMEEVIPLEDHHQETTITQEIEDVEGITTSENASLESTDVVMSSTQDKSMVEEEDLKKQKKTNETKGKPDAKIIKATKSKKESDSSSKSPKGKSKNDSKSLEKQNSDASESSTNSENSIRRSSRIKSISVLKQKSKGRGLAKAPNPEVAKKPIVDDTSESSSNGHDLDKVPPGLDSPSFNTPSNSESESKPVKVKSRWRRTSELEMSSSPAVSKCNSPLNTPDNSFQVISSTNFSKDSGIVRDKSTDDEEVDKRLKQFIHVKENHYLTERISCKEARKMTCDCFLTQEEVDRGEYGCGEDCLNRLLMIECGNLCTVKDRCTNKRFQKSQFAPVEVFRTDKKGLGLKAAAGISGGDFILEYVGEVLDPDEFEKRAAEYSKDKNQHYYFMSLRGDAVIDATQKGNISRFINHSCEPNAETQKWTVNGELRIGFFSKREIRAGEEITFDYQFQRYGKEAQKCYCEAPTCRGWLGEEPDDDDDEEEEEEDDEEEEEEDEEEQEIQEKSKDVLLEKSDENKNDFMKLKQTMDDEEDRELKELKEKVVKIKKKKEKKKVAKPKKTRKDIFDDLDLDEEIKALLSTGLKNQAHTLKLSRLMVRAKELSQRTQLLSILRNGEFPCRRLFLDYHGLRLIHGWMTDAQHMAKTDVKFEALRLEILQTLASLPIPNKTMLQDSKVLATVDKWSKSECVESSPMDFDSNSPKVDIAEPAGTIEPLESEDPKELKVKEETPSNEVSVSDEKLVQKDEALDQIETTKVGDIKDEIQKVGEALSESVCEDMDISPNSYDEKESLDDAKPEEKPVKINYKEEIVILALKLLDSWSTLKEVFRIPKKERIEQMKEHEREADRRYKAGLDMEHDMNERKADNRYRALQRHSRSTEKFDSTDRNRRVNKPDDPASRLSKHERRKLFEMQVEADKEKKRKEKEAWFINEEAFKNMGIDLRYAQYDHEHSISAHWAQQSKQWLQMMPNPHLASGSQGLITPTQSIIPSPSVTPSTPQAGFPSISQMMTQPPPNIQHLSMPPTPSYLPPTAQPMVSQAMHQGQMPLINRHVPPPTQNLPLPRPNLPIQPLINVPSNIQNIPLPQVSVQAQMPSQNIGLPQLNMGSSGQNLSLQGQSLLGMPPNVGFQSNNPAVSLGISNTSVPPPHIQSAPLQFPGTTPGVTHLPNMANLPNAITNIQPPLPAVPSVPVVTPLLDKINKKEEFIPTQFMGPIPPPAKLPPKWKCAKDIYGRPYYYHIKIRKAQWEPPEFTQEPKPEEEFSETESSSETSSLSSDSSSDDSDDEIIDDNKLLLQIRSKFEKMDDEAKQQAEKKTEDLSIVDPDKAALISILAGDDEENKEQVVKRPAKRRRVGLVQEIIISPRTEEDRLQFKEDLKRYKENKEQLKREKEMMVIVAQQKKSGAAKSSSKSPSSKRERHKTHSKSKPKEAEVSSEVVRKIKDKFRSNMATVMVSILNPYRKQDCQQARITSTDDFKHLARKLTHFVMLKELKHIQNIEDLTCTDSVKSKAREFVRKYMSKYGEIYLRDEMDNE